MKNSENNSEQSVSVLLFGAVLGTVASTMLHTSRGKQLLHDATVVFDDFVSLLEHTLDDKVSFEESVAGVAVFSDHVMDKLDRVDAFNARTNVKVTPVQSESTQRSELTLVKDKNSVAVAPKPRQQVTQEVPQANRSAFMYHKPVEVKKPMERKAVDDGVALLHQLGRQLYR